MCKLPIIWLGGMYLLAPSHYPYIQCRSNKQKRCGGRGRATTRAHPPHPLPARPYYCITLSSEIRVTSGARTTHPIITNFSCTLLAPAGNLPILVLVGGFVADPVPGPGKGQTRLHSSQPQATRPFLCWLGALQPQA